MLRDPIDLTLAELAAYVGDEGTLDCRAPDGVLHGELRALAADGAVTFFATHDRYDARVRKTFRGVYERALISREGRLVVCVRELKEVA